jgi:hypothetical protein
MNTTLPVYRRSLPAAKHGNAAPTPVARPNLPQRPPTLDISCASVSAAEGPSFCTDAGLRIFGDGRLCRLRMPRSGANGCLDGGSQSVRARST